jgi:Peptidase family M23
MLIVYLLQAIVPLVLIVWLAFAPPRNIAGFWTQSIATVLGLVAVIYTGIWTFPPWWMPYAFGLLLLATIIGTLMRKSGRPVWPSGILSWISLIGFAAFAVYAANETRVAVAAEVRPEGRVIDLASPLGPGSYLVANGGSAPSVNAHASLLDQSVAEHKPYWATGHGVDIVAINGWGLRANGIMPTDPQSYDIFGRSVIAPCDGEVITAVDGLPDLEVPKVDRSHLAGNHVILRCSTADILLGHFHMGSLVVQVGQRLSVGDAIAQVGNSGNTSEPHLHINAQEPGTTEAPFSGAPIPILINGRYLVRNDRFVVSSPDKQLNSIKGDTIP